MKHLILLVLLFSSLFSNSQNKKPDTSYGRIGLTNTRATSLTTSGSWDGTVRYNRSTDTLPMTYAIAKSMDLSDTSRAFLLNVEPGGGTGITFHGDSIIINISRWDTVKALLLISDTSYGLVPSGYVSAKGFFEDGTMFATGDSVYKSSVHAVFYNWGYVVKHWNSLMSDYEDDFEIIGYLNDSKKRLPKKYVIWQHLEIK